MGVGCVDGDGSNVPQDGTRNQPREDQIHCLYARFYLGGVV